MYAPIRHTGCWGKYFIILCVCQLILRNRRPLCERIVVYSVGQHFSSTLYLYVSVYLKFGDISRECVNAQIPLQCCLRHWKGKDGKGGTSLRNIFSYQINLTDNVRIDGQSKPCKLQRSPHHHENQTYSITVGRGRQDVCRLCCRATEEKCRNGHSLASSCQVR